MGVGPHRYGGTITASRADELRQSAVQTSSLGEMEGQSRSSPVQSHAQ